MWAIVEFYTTRRFVVRLTRYNTFLIFCSTYVDYTFFKGTIQQFESQSDRII